MNQIKQISSASPSPMPPFSACAMAVAAALLALTTVGARAQTAETAPATTQKVEKIEITGSSIKRIEGETALPVQVITREDIDKSGATTAAEIIRNISASTAPVTDAMSITDGTSGQRGFTGANLRGLGASSTLILLNGRRMANFATPGDNAGVDLNSIPAGAIQRVEVLKDGASAIYGTDAIGGVINFITRKDYQGLDLAATYNKTKEGGAGKQTFTISGGTGDLRKDGFNIFGALDVQQLDAMRSRQREFIRNRPLATNLPALMSSNTFPANTDVSTAQRNALIAAGLLPAGTTRTRVNPSIPNCNPPATLQVPLGPGGPVGCSYDYMQNTEIYPDSKKVGFIGRASFQIDAQTQIFAEYALGTAETTYRLSPPTVTSIRNLPVAILPTAYRNALTGAGLPTTFSRLRLRLEEAGGRTNEVTSDSDRIVVGVTGTAGSWDYDVGAAQAQNKATDKYVGGYVLFNQLEAGIRDGRINPFGASSQAGRDYLNSIIVNDEARKSKGVTRTVDVKASTPFARLNGGDAIVSIGAETRSETADFTPSALLNSNNILGDRDGSGLTTLAATSNTRRVTSFFTEASLPVSKELELQFAARHDRYEDAGNSTNPKFGLRWQPSRTILVRGSAGSGFRAPSIHDLLGPTTFGITSSILTDPQCVRSGSSIDFCTAQWPVERRSNKNLKPEKSRQYSLGVVVEPTKEVSFSVDYWRLEKRDIISTIGEEVIVNNPQLYNNRYIFRNSFGDITNIILQKENQGRLNTNGLDISADWRSGNTAAGRFKVGINGTLILKYDRQFGVTDPFQSNLGKFLNDQVIQRWRHRLAFDWDQGPFGVTLSNQYSSSYADQNTTYDPSTNALLAARRVEAYSLWDLSASWKPMKDLKLRAGVINLANTAPPFSNQAYFFIAGYDPTYTDPCGRTYTISAAYSFK